MNGKGLTFNDAGTWNYLRLITKNNYFRLLVSEAPETKNISGSSKVVKRVCFELKLKHDVSVGYCTYDYLLDIEVIGSRWQYSHDGGMSHVCRSLLSDVIHLKTNTGCLLYTSPSPRDA